MKENINKEQSISKEELLKIFHNIMTKRIRQNLMCSDEDFVRFIKCCSSNTLTHFNSNMMIILNDENYVKVQPTFKLAKSRQCEQTSLIFPLRGCCSQAVNPDIDIDILSEERLSQLTQYCKNKFKE